MKKAKEYAVELLDFYDRNKHKEDLQNIIADYVFKEVCAMLTDEIKNIAETRSCKTDACFNAIILEQINKWKSIVRKVNKEVPMLKEDGYLVLLHATGLFDIERETGAFGENKLDNNKEQG